MYGPLGRREPTDWEHAEKYPFSAASVPAQPVPVIAGTNWYREFYTPTFDPTDNRWWVARDGRLSRIEGGHAYCLKPESMRDLIGWWSFYDQGQEGACVGFATARALTMIERKRFDGRDIYHRAQKIDEWPGEAYEGTSVRAGIDVVREEGPRQIKRGVTLDPNPDHGIAVNRWATSMDDVYTCLKSPRLERQGVVAFMNSWGQLRENGRRGYPHIVYMPAEVFARLMSENGEVTVFTAR